MSDFEQPIIEYIAGIVAESGGGAVTRETPLLEAGVLDSINLVRLVQFLEERFGIGIPETDLGPELFEIAGERFELYRAAVELELA